MARPTSRRSLRFEDLEDRQLLSSVAPNNDQQLALQLINMARTTPQVASEWISKNVGSDVSRTLKHYDVDVDAVKATIASSRPLPPVAWNSDLADAAQDHSEDMADNGFQSHTGSDGSSPDERIKDAGYKADSAGENAFAYANNVDNAMQAFLYDWGVSDAGHRRNLLQPGVAPADSFTDVGVGVVKTGRGSGKIGPVVVTQNFASSADAEPQLVGVVYSDDDGDDFYTPGEGKGGVEIDATNLETGETDSTKTWDSGGYQMPLSAGRYQVTASDDDVVIKQVEVTVSKLNIAQNFLTSEKWDGRSLKAATTRPAATTAKPTPVASKPTPVASKPTPVASKPTPVASKPTPTPTPTPAPVKVVSTPSVRPASTSSASTSTASTPTEVKTVPKPTAVTVNSSTSSKLAFFAPSDWKGPAGSTTPAAFAPKSPLADWTTWKAKGR